MFSGGPALRKSMGLKRSSLSPAVPVIKSREYYAGWCASANKRIKCDVKNLVTIRQLSERCSSKLL